MLLSVSRSLTGWSRVGWFGHWMVGGSLAFFYLGGASYLKRVQEKRVWKAEVGKVGKDMGGAPFVTPGPITPGPHVVPPVDIVFKEVEKKL